jgi:RNA-directed DNA polymerase
MLHEFDAWLEAKYLNRKARKDRWAWNFGIQQEIPSRFARTGNGNLLLPIVAMPMTLSSSSRGQGHAEAIREECRAFLEDRLKLTLNMEKTHITHVDDGFVFLGHRIIRKRGPNGTHVRGHDNTQGEKAKAFVRKLTVDPFRQS